MRHPSTLLALPLLLTLAAPAQARDQARGPVTCTPSATTLCLNSSRFEVEVDWEDELANTGAGQVLPFGFDDTGFFYFADPDLPDLVIKVLDGTAINDHWWVFYAGLTEWEFTVTVTDTASGEQQIYFNPFATYPSIADTAAFHDPSRHPGSGAPAPLRALEPPARGAPVECVPGPTVLCLDQNRFQVEVEWQDFTMTTGAAQTMSLTGLSGYFTFFTPTNVDLLVKIVDGGASGSFWFFYGGLADLGYTITVTDRCSGAEKVYTNSLGTRASVADYDAFPLTPSCIPPIFEDGFESGDTTVWQ